MKTERRKIIWMVLLAVMSVCSPAWAAAVDLTGTWEGGYHTMTAGYHSATANLVQTGSAVSGTYTSTSGLEGNLTGTLTEEALEFTIAHTGNCEGFFYGTAVLKGEILYVDMGGTDCILKQPEAFTAVLAENFDDSFSPLVVVSKERHGDGHLTGSFWCSLNHTTPESIETVSVASPGGLEIDMEFDEDEARWEGYLGELDADKIDTLFPNGIYVFKIEYHDGTTATAGAVHDAEYPSFYPVITTPVHGALVDPSRDLTVVWEAADASVDGIGIDIGDESVTDYSRTVTEHTQPADMIEDDTRYDIWLSFSQDSPYYFPGKNFGQKKLASLPYFFTGSRLVESWLGLIKVQAPSGDSGMVFISHLESAGVSSASLTIAGGESLPFVYDAYERGWIVEELATEAQAAARFPEGNYALAVDFTTGPSEQRTIYLGGSAPQVMPAVISPANRAVVDKGAPALDIRWSPWPGGAGIVSVEIEKIDAIPPDNGFDADYQEKVWEGFFDPDVTQASVPMQLLDPASAFQLAVMFVNPAGAGVFRVNRRHVFFETGCDRKVSHTRMGFNSPGGSDTITITAADCFSWRAKSDDSWINITSGTGGTGNGTVTYSVTDNWRTVARQGILTVAGETVKIYQLEGQTACAEAPVKIGDTGYNSIQTAYNDSETGETIRCQYAELAENPAFNRDVMVTLVGGYNCDYNENPDFTTVEGAVVVNKGTVVLDGVIVAGE